MTYFKYVPYYNLKVLLIAEFEIIKINMLRDNYYLIIIKQIKPTKPLLTGDSYQDLVTKFYTFYNQGYVFINFFVPNLGTKKIANQNARS